MSINTVAGSALFSSSESFMGFVQDLSEQDEVIFAGGTGKSKGKSGSKKSKKSKSKSYGYGYH